MKTLDRKTEIREAVIDLLKAAATVCGLGDQDLNDSLYGIELDGRSEASVYLGYTGGVRVDLFLHVRDVIAFGYFEPRCVGEYRVGVDDMEQIYENPDEMTLREMDLTDAEWLYLFLSAVGAGDFSYTITINDRPEVQYSKQHGIIENVTHN